ncbi:unnamed protein product [Trifolium pratense]|uniref:Uncharacterized protein n=1 Tax=Trifolium pratense TaxID=57577 RepID=A0ACB0KJM0_TRIPR|nr:unnamed protein product [Trifolium pratense]
MTYSNPTHLYYPYPTTIPTFSPFYSSTVPSTYPTTIPNPTPTPTPNPSFPSYPHHLHDPSYHPPPSFTHPPYSSYPNSTASPSPNHYTSYTTSSTSDYGYSTHYNYPQHQPPHSYSQPARPASPNAEMVQRSCNEILEFIEEFRNEMKESFQDIQESFQEVSESLKSRAKNIQNVFSTLRRDLQEKIEKEQVEEHTADTPKKFVEGGYLQIIQEHQEKEEELEISPNPKPSPPPMFPSTLLSPLKPLNLLIVHSAHSPPTQQLLLKELDRVPAPSLSTEPPPKPPDRCLITAILTFKAARDLNPSLPPLRLYLLSHQIKELRHYCYRRHNSTTHRQDRHKNHHRIIYCPVKILLITIRVTSYPPTKFRHMYYNFKPFVHEILWFAATCAKLCLILAEGQWSHAHLSGSKRNWYTEFSNVMRMCLLHFSHKLCYAYNALTNKYTTSQLSNAKAPTVSHKYHKGSFRLGRSVMGQISAIDYFCTELGLVSPQQNFVDLLYIRPARKPPDLSLNLEDKVQVNPAAMIED